MKLKLILAVWLVVLGSAWVRGLGSARGPRRSCKGYEGIRRIDLLWGRPPGAAQIGWCGGGRQGGPGTVPGPGGGGGAGGVGPRGGAGAVGGGPKKTAVGG